MKRRAFCQTAVSAAWLPMCLTAFRSPDWFDVASEVLAEAVDTGKVDAAVFYVRHRDQEFIRPFGTARTVDVPFLLGSISKPMAVATLMTLLEDGAFRLDDPVRRFLPEFTGGGRDRVTVGQLLTHVSGLPDQLPENDALRSRHATLPEFVEQALQLPIAFEPGTQYQYSSMAILLASEIAQRISGSSLEALMEKGLFQPLGMNHSALGLGRFSIDSVMRCQTEHAAPESGAGDPIARHWDWNSPYWRQLGAPWGGVHASAADVGRFYAEFFLAEGKALRPETIRLVLRNHNAAPLPPRGLGFALGEGAGSPGCSEETFGHTGSTGTLAWGDPASATICVILTTLPGRALNPHPRSLASDHIAAGAPSLTKGEKGT